MKIDQALEITSFSHPGQVRSHNEDSVGYEALCGLVVLADGMGGYNAGEVASGMTVSVLSTEIKSALLSNGVADEEDDSGEDIGATLLRNNVKKANATIYHAAQSQPQYAGMGTTVVAALFYDNHVAVAHVGDSRMYRLRGDTFETITRDHSLLQDQIDSGLISVADARKSMNKNLVTRAVGIDMDVDVEVHVHSVQVGDVYLLCSDGLNDMVPDDDIGSALQMLQANLTLAASQLIEMANDNGGRDNVSVILVKIKGDFAVSHSWLEKLSLWFKKVNDKWLYKLSDRN